METQTMNKTQRRQERLHRHYQRIAALSNHNGIWVNIPQAKKMSSALLRLEREASKLSLDWANGDIDCAQWEEMSKDITRRVKNVFNGNLEGFYLNSDPRGYALKIDDAYMREHNIDLERDWGGYGLLAPEINGDA